MARYIDADATLNKLPDDLPYKASVKRVLMQAQEADVVPKSEIEELSREYESLAKTVNEASELIRKLRSKVEKSKTEETKPTEEGDYFTPAQVREMTVEEVKANYAKIINSMSRWH